MNKYVWIDTDPGIDDAFAIMVALKRLNVIGISAVSGNKSLEVTRANALRLVDYLGVDVPVYEGAEANLASLETGVIPPADASEIHGKDGMGNSGLDYTNRMLQKEKAWDALLETVKKYPDKSIDLITLGPLTNIALACRIDKEIMKKLNSIYIMGGSVTHQGNVNPYAEFNIWFDAQSCNEVLAALANDVKIVFDTLDSNRKCLLSGKQIESFLEIDNPVSKLMYKIVQHYRNAQLKKFHRDDTLIHDLECVLSYMDESIIASARDVKLKVLMDDVHIGQTVEAEDGYPCSYIEEIDKKKSDELFFNLLRSF